MGVGRRKDDDAEKVTPVAINGFLWKPVLRKIATLQEIENFWSLVDLIDANVSLAASDEFQKKQMDKAKRDRKTAGKGRRG